MISAAISSVRTDKDMDQPVRHSFVGGSVALFSAARPNAGRPNEDAAALFQVDEQRGVLVVTDGLGGMPGGAGAARTALDCLERSLKGAAFDTPIRSAILDAVELANQQLIELGTGTATTLAAIEIEERTLRPYHVGDSAILVVGQRGRIKLQTVAHSPVGYALESGLLDEREALHHDDRHIVSNVVGMRDMRIEVGSRLSLSPHDTALLATDGLFDNLSLDEAIEIVRAGPLERAASELVARCRQRMSRPTEGLPSKPDDLTFVIFRPTASRSTARKTSRGQRVTKLSAANE